jgi:hypothetical protein
MLLFLPAVIFLLFLFHPVDGVFRVPYYREKICLLILYLYSKLPEILHLCGQAWLICFQCHIKYCAQTMHKFTALSLLYSKQISCIFYVGLFFR